ncbi:MAG: hypothetical protein AB7U49_04670 [Hyphomicrobiaceae bacterium]
MPPGKGAALVAAAAAIVLGAPLAIAPLAPALAASITNRDGRQHTLMIGAGAAAETIVLKDGQSTGSICPKGCLVRLGSGGNGSEYVIEKNDSVSIEDGKLFYDDGAGVPGVAPVQPPTVPPLRGER